MLQPGWSKIATITKAARTGDVSQLRSFLGIATYCAPSIPNLATLAHPLWVLTKDNVEFKWEDQHEQAMESIKQVIVTRALGFFDVNWETEVIVDASPVGLAVVCTQFNRESPQQRKIVTFASRMLTEIEKRYSQIEKEAYAVVWACERLYLYLLGKHFRSVTDNRAVQLIFGNPKSKPPPRIQRWALRLMSFDFEIVHRPGNSNIADYLSRNPIDTPKSSEQDADEYIAFLVEHAVPKSMKL
jgi:hypothetical protein